MSDEIAEAQCQLLRRVVREFGVHSNQADCARVLALNLGLLGTASDNPAFRREIVLKQAEELTRLARGVA